VGVARTVRLLRGALLELAWYLGMPGMWLWQFFRLLGFVVAMLPAFVPVFWHYLRSKRIVKNITYGPSIRHQLDVYLPAAAAGGECPVVIFVSGGAWVIGYKMWSFLMGCVLQERGILFVSPDYRNFPQGQVPDMVRDVTEAVKWTLSHAHHLGGDPKNITLIGACGVVLNAFTNAYQCALFAQGREGETERERDGGDCTTKRLPAHRRSRTGEYWSIGFTRGRATHRECGVTLVGALG